MIDLSKCREWWTNVTTPAGVKLIDYHFGIPGEIKYFFCIAKDLEDARERRDRKMKEKYGIDIPKEAM